MTAPRPPNIRHLAAVAATVRHGTVTAAAKAINLTQPALTQAIARVEAELDCTLFERSAAGMKPAPPALVLAPRIDTAIALIGSTRVTGSQVHAFVAVARAGGYTGAADKTGLSPASLHRSVSDLSLALGQRLIARKGHGIELTRAGERRARAFGLALAELRSGYAEVAAWLGRAAERMVIGAMPLSRARWLPAAMVRFRAGHAGVKLAVVEGSYAEMIGPLRDGEIDFLLGALRPGQGGDDIVQVPAFEDRPKVIMRRGHPLAGKALEAPDLARYPWILPASETPLRRYWKHLFEQCGVPPPDVDIECGSVLTARELMVRTNALALLSPDQLRVELDAGLLVAADPPAAVSRTIGIHHRRAWRPTHTQAAMLDILRDEAQAVS
ncbi:MAG: LysR family transcriptional regulator [Tsuneonella sp.]